MFEKEYSFYPKKQIELVKGSSNWIEKRKKIDSKDDITIFQNAHALCSIVTISVFFQIENWKMNFHRTVMAISISDDK